MIISFLIYFLTAVISANIGSFFIKHKDKKMRLLGIFIVSTILGLIAANRGYTGTDSYTYSVIYSRPQFYFHLNEIGIGYSIIMYICNIMRMSYKGLFFVMGFFTSWFALLFIKEESEYIDVKIAIYIFVLTLFYLSFNIMRQILVVPMCLYAMSLYMRDKKIIFLIYLALAVSIHQSSIICLFIIFADKIANVKNYKTMVMVIAVCMVYAVADVNFFISIWETIDKIDFISSIIGDYYGKYFKHLDTIDIHGIIVQCCRSMPIIIICSMLMYKIVDDKKLKVYYIMMLLGYSLSFLGVLTGKQAERIGYYYSYFNIVLLGMAAKVSTKFGKLTFRKEFNKLIIYAFITLLFIYMRIYRNYGGLVPYGITDIMKK